MLNFSTFRKRKIGTTAAFQHSAYSNRIKAPVLRNTSMKPIRRTIGHTKPGMSFRRRQGMNTPINA